MNVTKPQKWLSQQNIYFVTKLLQLLCLKEHAQNTKKKPTFEEKRIKKKTKKK